MTPIITTIITGIFSILIIWYKDYLERKRTASKPEHTEANTSTQSTQGKIDLRKSYNRWVTICISIFLFIGSMSLLLIFGKDKIVGMDNNLSIYYFVWVLIVVFTAVMGWRIIRRFEKVMLVASIVLNGWMSYFTYDEWRRNQELSNSAGEAVIVPADTLKAE